MDKSENINELATALAKAQALFESPKKTAKGYSWNFADLASYLDVIKEPLTSNGLSIIQLPTLEDKLVSVETVLMHSSGQWIKSKLSAPVEKLTAQGVGSAISYCRRYAIAAILNLAAKDDDGEGAVEEEKDYGNSSTQYQKTHVENVRTVLLRLITQKNISRERVDGWIARFKVNTLADIPEDGIYKIVEALEKE